MTASLIRRNEVNVGATPVEFDYTGEMDIIKASYDSQIANFNFSSAYEGRADLYRQNFDKYAFASGSDIKTLIDVTVPVADQYSKFDSIIKQKREQGEQSYLDIKTSEEIDQDLMQKARDAEQEAARVESQAAPDTWVFASKLIGGAAGWVTDPVQFGATLMTLPAATAYGLGSTATTTIAKTIAVESVAEMGVEAFSQTGVYEWQQKLGNEYGAKEIAMAIATAGVLSGAFTGTGFGLAKAFGAKIPTTELIEADKEKARFSMMQPNRVSDSDLLEAHYKNIDLMANDLSRIESPRLAIEPSASPLKFADDAVTQEHLRVARTVPDTMPMEVHAKDVFIREMIDEFTVNQNLARGNLEQITARLAENTQKLSEVAKKREAKQAELATADPALKPVIESQIRTLDKEKRILDKSNKSLTSRVETTAKAVEADAYLQSLKTGEIPAELKPRFDTYLKNVKAADDEFKSWSRKLERLANEIKEPDFVGPPTQRLMEAMNSFVGPIRRGEDFTIPEMKDVEAIAPEIEAATDRAFQVEAKKSATGESSTQHDFTDIDGNDMKMNAADIDAAMKEEESLLSVLKSCFFGSAT